MIVNKFKRFARFLKPKDDGDDLGGGGDTVVDRGDTVEHDPNYVETTAERNARLKAEQDNPDAGDPNKGGDDKDPKDPKDEDDKDPKGKIPVSRHRELLRRERERNERLERELREFQGGKRVAETNESLTRIDGEIATLEAAYAKQLADGKPDEAAATMAKIRGLDREAAEVRADQKIAAATARAVEQTRFDTALDRIEGAFPMLNPDHDDFDEDKHNEVLELVQAYQLRGRTPTDALQRAVKLVMGEPENRKQEQAITVKPRVDEGDKDGKDDPPRRRSTDVEARRRQDAVDRSADAVRRTPPATSGAGSDSDRAGKLAKPVSQMSEKEFSELDEAELARRRGDLLD